MVLSPTITSFVKNSSEIVTSVLPYLQEVVFDDRLGGTATTLEIIIIRTPSTPAFARGDYLKVIFSNGGGYTNLDTGTMRIDRIDSTFQPNKLTIGCQAYDYALAMKGGGTIAYQGSTLRAIVSTQSVFPSPHLTVDLTRISPEIAGAASTDGGTDYKESAKSRIDLLQQLAIKYGYAFQMRAGILIFRPYEDTEGDRSVRTINVTDCSPGAEFEDNTAQMVSNVYVEHNQAGYTNLFDDASPTGDILDLRSEGWYASPTIASRRAYGAIKEKNANWKTGRLQVPGDGVFIARENVTLVNFFEWDGKWAIVRASHKISNQLGWVVNLELRKINV